MKKEICLVRQKHERIIIRYRQKKKIINPVNEDTDQESEWLTVNEAAELSGSDANEIRQNLIILRKKQFEDKIPKH
jgi:hypothetical protein